MTDSSPKTPAEGISPRTVSIRSLSTSIPEISPSTHVLALYGPDDIDPFDGDGWFFADLCLLNRLFVGLGASQAWLTPPDIQEQLSQYGQVVHGMPESERKVVCENISQLRDLVPLPNTVRKSEFLRRLEVLCNTCKPGGNILVLLLGHGLEALSHLYIGSADDNRFLEKEEVKAAMSRCNRDVRVAILMTSCYSGGWIDGNDMNASIMTGGGLEDETNSLNRSLSDRFGGSTFVTAVAREILDANPPQTQVSSYGDFTQNVSVTNREIYGVDKQLGYSTPRFQAQGNSWTMPLHDATGIERASYQEYFDALPNYPLNPDLIGRAPGEDSERLTGSIRRAYVNPTRAWTRSLVRTYEDLNPGVDTQASNVVVHGLIMSFKQRNSKPFSLDRERKLIAALRFRIGSAILAESFLTVMGLRPFMEISMYDPQQWIQAADSHRRQLHNSAWLAIDKTQLIRRPRKGYSDGLDFRKPRHYLAAAFANKGLDEVAVEARLKALVKLIKVRIMTRPGASLVAIMEDRT